MSNNSIQLCNSNGSIQLCNSNTKIQLCRTPAPCTCPCQDDWPGTSGEGWPCNGLLEDYQISNAIESPFDGAMVYRSDIYRVGGDCYSGTYHQIEELRLVLPATASADSGNCTWETPSVAVERRFYNISGGWATGSSPDYWQSSTNRTFTVSLKRPSPCFWRTVPSAGGPAIAGDARLETGLTPVGLHFSDTCAYYAGPDLSEYEMMGFNISESAP